MLDIKLKRASADKQTGPCVVVPIIGKLAQSPAAKQIDDASAGYIKQILRKGDLAEKAGATLLLHEVPGIKAQRVLLVATGNPDKLTEKSFGDLIKKTIGALKAASVKSATLFLGEIEVASRSTAWVLEQIVETTEDAFYRFDQLKSKQEDAPALASLTLALPSECNAKDAQQAIDTGQAIAKGKSQAKTLGNLPGNICTPTYLADQAKQMAKDYKKLTTKIVDEKAMEELGMGALLSVSAGSREPAKLIVMQYRGGAKKQAPQMLVGKGVTFDTGGISLKPGGAMDEMKFDMCGAASVFGAVTAAAELDLPLNIIGVIAAAENMPGGEATKPGDIVTTMSGKTVEILNTDAEGRLVLCDALTYVKQFKPAAVIDVATLTGACVVAFGKHATALYANDDDLKSKLEQAGQTAYDRAWPMPLWDEYQQQLKSNFADIANIGGAGAGSITAACFLSRFAEEYPWAHLDIAGVAWLSGGAKGATGRPVAMLTHYLMNCVD